MPDKTTTSKSDVEAENARLRSMLEAQGVNPDEALDPNQGTVGNLADLQRLGALAVAAGTTKVDDAIVPFKPEPQEPVDLAAPDRNTA